MIIDNIASAIYSALFVDISDIEETRSRWIQSKVRETYFVKRRPYFYDVEIYSFPQTWSSTALGFGGIGGQAITSAQTTVVICGNEACVYFGGRFAYKVENTKDEFY